MRRPQETRLSLAALAEMQEHAHASQLSLADIHSVHMELGY